MKDSSITNENISSAPPSWSLSSRCCRACWVYCANIAITSLGASLATSTFALAFKVPNLFRRLFGEGVLSAAFIPIFTDTHGEKKVSKPPLTCWPTPWRCWLWCCWSRCS